jgi:hypothetical protein
LAKSPPKGALLAEDVNRHIEQLRVSAEADPLVFMSRSDFAGILSGFEVSIAKRRVDRFFLELNAAILNYDLRLAVEKVPLSSWFPRYQQILTLLMKLRVLLPDRTKDELLFNIIRHVGEQYAARQGPHPDLVPFELADPLDNFPFPVNYRSDERLERTIFGLKEVTEWMRTFVDGQVDPITQSNEERMSAATWLIGYELPRIYEKFFKRRFGRPGIRFILLVLEVIGIVASTGKKYSPIAVKTYRRRARKYGQR